jgi:hypothetical protein
MTTASKRTQAAAAAADAGKPDTYVVLSNLMHDGDFYVPGEKVKLDPISAEPLIAAGVVEATK